MATEKEIVFRKSVEELIIKSSKSIIQYSIIPTGELVSSKIEEGSYIEAYVLADQYVDDLLAFTFADIHSLNKHLSELLKRIGYEALLFISTEWIGNDHKYVDKYIEFKKQRNKLVHDVLNQSSRNQLYDTVLKRIISQYISTFEELHLKRFVVYQTQSYEKLFKEITDKHSPVDKYMQVYKKCLKRHS